MAQVLTKVKEGLKVYELEAILETLTKMVDTKGHGLAYQLNSNLFNGKKVLKDYYERLDQAKQSFFEKDEAENVKQFTYNELKELVEVKPGEAPKGQTVGRIPSDQIQEAGEMLKNFNDELLNVNFKQLDENKLNEALENSIFDGIDLTPLFDTLIN